MGTSEVEYQNQLPTNLFLFFFFAGCPSLHSTLQLSLQDISAIYLQFVVLGENDV